MPPMVDDDTSSDWRLIDLSCTSVFENLALEEAIARGTGNERFQSTIRFWVNPRCVVLGRFQEASSEVDVDFCKQNGITVARRFTGGGAVYHDEGNLNYTITTHRRQRVDLRSVHETYSAITLEALRGFGLKGTFLPPNSILLGDRKVAGAAAALGKEFNLWHSSILVSSDLDALHEALAPSRRQFSGHFVHSNWIPVTTLEKVTGKSLNVDEVKTQLVRAAQETLGIRLRLDQLGADEQKRFSDLLNWKYSSDSWNRHAKAGDRDAGFEAHTTIAV